MPSRSRPGSRWLLLALVVAPLGCASTAPPEAASARSSPAGSTGQAAPARQAAAECQALAHVLNNGVQRVGSDLSGSSDRAEELRATAVAVDDLVHQIDSLPLREPQLVRLAHDYKSMAQALASGTRDLAGGVREGDRSAMDRAKATIEAAVAQEDPIVDQINVFCSGGAPSDPGTPEGPRDVQPQPEADPSDTEVHET